MHFREECRPSARLFVCLKKKTEMRNMKKNKRKKNRKDYSGEEQMIEKKKKVKAEICSKKKTKNKKGKKEHDA